MNQKELNEIRRHLSLKRCGIHKIYGCFVSSGKEIISDFQTSFGLMSEFEAEKYLSLLKKTLSGTLGKNLLDLSFSTQQVVDSPEHKRLSALRNTQLEEPSARAAFFQSVIASLSLGDTPYLILLAHDVYDVPHRGGDDELQADASDQVFSYLLCAICPVKEEKPELAYAPGDKVFRTRGISQIISPPELGFLFPTFDQRAANLYHALFYTKHEEEIHQDFIDEIFHTGPLLSAASSGKPSSTLSRFPSMRPAATMSFKGYTSSFGNALPSTRRAETQSPWTFRFGRWAPYSRRVVCRRHKLRPLKRPVSNSSEKTPHSPPRTSSTANGFRWPPRS